MKNQAKTKEVADMIRKDKIKAVSKKCVLILKTTLIKSVQAVKKFAAGHKQMPISLGILVLGVLITIVMIKLRRPPHRVEQKSLAPLVKVRELKARDIEMIVRSYGTVSPKVEVEIVPQVSGKVVWVNPKFKAGGFIRASEQLLKIDSRDYELAVQQEEALVAEAQVNLDLERAEAQVAQKEWKQLHPETEPGSPLVFREPQVRQAQARLKSAEAALSTAKLSLERTVLSLPVDVRIISEKVDLGQHISTGQSVGFAYGIESVEIVLPLEDRELRWFDVPNNNIDGKNSSVRGNSALVKANFSGREHTWPGYVVRTTGQVDKTSRLVSVVIEVPEPFNNSRGSVPLLPGMFVEVMIKGNVLHNAVAIPREAVRKGNEVWVVEEERLHIKTFDIVRKDKDFIYSTSSLSDGVVIVVSSLDAVTEGMKVRVQPERDAEADVLKETIN